ncbi:MAG: hypothetical protein ACW96U_00715 [Candidatus Heimdallarchaeaceae archaeon]|jgi:hypothetical protein
MESRTVQEYLNRAVPGYLRSAFLYEYEKYSNGDSLDAYYTDEVLEMLQVQAEERFEQSR